MVRAGRRTSKPMARSRVSSSTRTAKNSRVKATQVGKSLSRAKSARPPKSRAQSTGEKAGRALFPATIERLFAKLSEAIPEPKSELQYRTPFELLVSVILSAQATDKSVNLATERLFPVARTPQSILDLGEAGLLSFVRTIGLAPTKTKNILATCGQLLELHGGQVPAEREALEALPGVGRKTANVVLNTAFDQATLAVDTHVFRVANRTGLAPGKTVREVEDGLMRVVPPHYLKTAHHLLILHGRYTCKARQPACPTCPIRAECAWPEKVPASKS
jgi:endonuclease III